MKSTSTLPTIDIKKYGGKQVAILDGKIIAEGNTLQEVIDRAKILAPSRPLQEIKIFSVPKTLAVIYYVPCLPVRHHASRRRSHRRIPCR